MNVGLIGLEGHWGVITEGVEAMEDVNVTAVWNYGPVDSFLNWPGHRQPPRVYDDWREMLEREELDIVSTNVYHNHQTEILLECCKLGIHLLPEKPLTYDWAEYERVRQAVEESGVFISLLLTMRFEPPKRAVHDAVRAGLIGEVTMAAAQKSYKQGDRPQWQRERASWAGIIPFVGVHAIDQIMWTTGLDIVEVMAYQGNIGKPEYRDMENQGTVIALLSNGASAVATMDFCRPAAAPTHGDDRVRVAGTHGIVESRTLGDLLELVTHDQPPTRLELPQVEPQFVNYVRALRGETECVVPAEHVWRITEVCLRAREAAEMGKAMQATPL